MFKYKSSESQSSETVEWEEEMKSFFTETEGEVYVGEVSCQLYTMELTNFLKFKFTEPFINGLRSLQYAATATTKKEIADAIFRDFVNDFGIFYIKHVSMGSKLLIETRFASSSNSASEATKRFNCIHDSYGQRTEVGFGTPNATVKVPGEKGTIEAGIPTLNIGTGSGSGFQNSRYGIMKIGIFLYSNLINQYNEHAV